MRWQLGSCVFCQICNKIWRKVWLHGKVFIKWTYSAKHIGQFMWFMLKIYWCINVIIRNWGRKIPSWNTLEQWICTINIFRLIFGAQYAVPFQNSLRRNESFLGLVGFYHIQKVSQFRKLRLCYQRGKSVAPCRLQLCKALAISASTYSEHC